MESERSLWLRVRGGDGDAFGLLFERHATGIYNYCFRRVGDWAVAEDLLSIVFLEAWRRRDKELDPDKVVAWLYGIATNVVRNRRRAERRYAAALQRVTAARPEPLVTELSDERLADERQMKHVLALVSALPRREQDVLALSVWAGLSYEETAAALAIPVGTVRSRLSRARRRLRHLEPAGPQPPSQRAAVEEAVGR
jgi:RNA polymerase sigma-70 factor (ECF subfamily)